MSAYWILEWITAEELTSLEQAERRLTEKRGLARLVEFAAEQASKPIPVIPEAANQLLGGRGMDLSGVLECSNSKCIKKKVDEVLYRAWHYFDLVVVNGLDSRRFMESLRHKDSMAEEILGRLIAHIDVAFYIRDTGAEGALIFCDRSTHFCQNCLDRDLVAAGFSGSLEEVREKLINSLYRNSKVTRYTTESGEGLYQYEHPALDISTLRRYPRASCPELDEFAQDIAKGQAETYIAHAIRSAAIARKQSAALGHLVARSGVQLEEVAGRPTPQEVAFNLQLPVIQSLPINELLSFRAHEAAEFHAFRAALRMAIEERLKALPDANAEKVAESVYEDVLEPALISLDRKTSKAVDLLAKRSIATLAVGSVVTTVGLLAFAPIVVPGIVIAAGGTLANYLEWVKDRKEVELSDLHFLWQLTEKAAARHSRD